MVVLTTVNVCLLVRSLIFPLVSVPVVVGRNCLVMLWRISSPLVVPYMLMCRAPVPTTTGTVPLRLLSWLIQTRMPLVLALTIGIPEPCMIVRTSLVLLCGTNMLTRLCVLTTVAVFLCLHLLMALTSVGLNLPVVSVLRTIVTAVVPACLVLRFLCSTVVPLDPRYRSVILMAMPGWVLQTTLTMLTGMRIRPSCSLPLSAHLCLTLLIGLGSEVMR